MHKLPPIEEWWPELSPDLKEAILKDVRAPLSSTVIDTVRGPSDLEHITISGGYDVIRLTPSEQTFARAHPPDS